MPERIRVLLADDSYQLRQSVKAMLQLESGFTVVGEAENGRQAVALALELHPDVVLMDINMPELDGIAATAAIMQQHPTNIVIISVQGEQDYLRRAMKAGARDYLLKPFTLDELVNALRSAVSGPAFAVAPGQGGPAAAVGGLPVHQGKIITLFSTKGGVGKTTIAGNLAVALALETKAKVAAVDLDLEFGSLSTLLGLRPQGTILDLCRVDGPLQPAQVTRVMVEPAGLGIKVLAAPPLPHLAAEVDGDGRREPNRGYVAEILDALRSEFDYIICDTASNFRETNLVAFDKSDIVLLVTSPEIPALSNTAKGLDILLDRLEYSQSKVQIVLNRSDAAVGLTLQAISDALKCTITYQVPSDGQTATWAANAGQPFVLRRSRSLLSEAMRVMAVGIASGKPALASKAARLTATARPRRKLMGLFSLR